MANAPGKRIQNQVTMQNPIAHVPLVFNEAESQFEIHIDGQVAFIEFVKKTKKIWLTHTEVPKSLEGRGIGSAMVEKALQYIRDNNWVLVPSCSFVAAYVNKHADEWHSLLSEGYQM